MTNLTKCAKKVRVMTHYNDHLGAVTAIARFVADKHNNPQEVNCLMDAALAVEKLYKFYGFMPPYLNNIRNDVRDRCFNFLNEEETKAFNDAL